MSSETQKQGGTRVFSYKSIFYELKRLSAQARKPPPPAAFTVNHVITDPQVTTDPQVITKPNVITRQHVITAQHVTTTDHVFLPANFIQRPPARACSRREKCGGPPPPSPHGQAQHAQRQARAAPGTRQHPGTWCPLAAPRGPESCQGLRAPLTIYNNISAPRHPTPWGWKLWKLGAITFQN